jgi:DNA invertase Pin-like site-specific DNA recombinase
MKDRDRIGIYLRCSTSDQSVELQKRELLKFAELRGWDEFQIFQDSASGTNSNRKGLKALMGAAQKREIDIVLVWKLDRFARSLKDLVNMMNELSEVGVFFVSLKDNIDCSTSSGRLMLHVIGAFAEFEASLIRERVKAGLENARANGKKLGRPQKVNKREVIKLRSEGFSLREIALKLNVSKSAVHKTLSKLTS